MRRVAILLLLLSLPLLSACARGANRSPGFGASPSLAIGPAQIENPQVGVEYRVQILTHCGFRPEYFDDSWWTFDANPDISNNEGFLSGMDSGTLVMVDSDHAEYTSTRGGVIGLTRGGKQPELCM